MNYLIKLAVILGVGAAISGQLPKIIYHLRLAQLELIKESQASKWGTPVLFTNKKHR